MRSAFAPSARSLACRSKSSRNPSADGARRFIANRSARIPTSFSWMPKRNPSRTIKLSARTRTIARASKPRSAISRKKPPSACAIPAFTSAPSASLCATPISAPSRAAKLFPSPPISTARFSPSRKISSRRIGMAARCCASSASLSNRSRPTRASSRSSTPNKKPSSNYSPAPPTASETASASPSFNSAARLQNPNQIDQRAVTEPGFPALARRQYFPHNRRMTPRDLAAKICRKLRESGHQAYLVGGCVRDLELGREPEDFDVSTDAHPERVQELFPESLAIGAQFGVILVVEDGAQVEVATFRSDVGYSDGRHPDSLVFSPSAREDVFRRDFTINGLLLDPVTGEVLDNVGGRADLRAKIIRAIGDPETRFREDKLRMVRAVRFSARFGFAIEPNTLAAIKKLAHEI